MPSPARLTPAERRALADAVRMLRAREMLTQHQVAERAGLGRNYVGDLEAGRRRASFEAVVLIARGLGVSLGELVAVYEGRVRETRVTP